VESGTFPAIPVHQDDPIPHLNLALRTCGHVEQWQHVPGLTAVRGVHRRAPERPLFPSSHPQSPTHVPPVFAWSSVVFPACRRIEIFEPTGACIWHQVGREWISAAIMLRDPAASTGDSVMVCSFCAVAERRFPASLCGGRYLPTDRNAGVDSGVRLHLCRVCVRFLVLVLRCGW
jgi:hypothetical protein